MESTKRVFDRTSDGKVSFFYLDKVTSNKSEKGKIYKVVNELDKEALQFHVDKFTRGGGMMNVEMDYKKAVEESLEKYERKKGDPTKIIQAALHFSLDIKTRMFR